MERTHTKSLDANDKLIQTRSHVRDTTASRKRQVRMRKVKSTIKPNIEREKAKKPKTKIFLTPNAKKAKFVKFSVKKANMATLKPGRGPSCCHMRFRVLNSQRLEPHLHDFSLGQRNCCRPPGPGSEHIRG